MHPRNQHIFLLSSLKAVLQSALIQHLRQKKVQKLILSASLFCFALFCHFVAFTHIQMDVDSRPVRALQCRLQQNQTNTCTSRVYTHRLPSSYKDLFVIEISSLYSHMAHSLQNSTTQRVMSYLWQTERC